jgi:predicted RNA-binding Zn ribbon-like protein
VTFAHDTEAALVAAVALVNSAEEPDTLITPAQLEEFFGAHRYTGRAPLRRLLTGDRDTVVALVNRILAERQAVPQLVRHDGWDYHLHATDPGGPFADRIAVETAMAMVDVIRADELSRLSVCAGATCDGVVLDLSRNRSRRYCSTACGNRIAVAAYRSRKVPTSKGA